MALALLAIIAALAAGLVRLGWHLPGVPARLVGVHGPLAVSFLGTVITLERAAALQHPLPYLAPVMTGVGAALVIGLPHWAGPLLILSGSLGLSIISIWLMRRQPALFTAVMVLGALGWAVGNTLWLLARPIPRAVPWWMAFLVLTIVAERLELSRLLRLSSGARVAFAFGVGLLLAGGAATTLDFAAGMRMLGGGLLALAVWLLANDIARTTARREGLTRFIGICMLSGYAWLVVAGALGLVYGGVMAGPRYDALLHAVFLGFVGAMIFGHAPIILPPLLDIGVPYHSGFYLPLGMLHLSLALRIVADVAGWWSARQWGGLLNVLAVLFFAAAVGFALRQPAWQPAGHPTGARR
jgi:hypothetical protein